VSLSRRAFLGGGALAAGTFALRALAAPPNNLRDGEILPDPDFSRLRAANPYVIGVRPHRKGGVRLELEPAPFSTASGKKWIIHNYGHGGGGITLSWGCASVVTDLVRRAIGQPGGEPARVAVLGSGVIGLTSATEIHRLWPKVPLSVYARTLELRATTSFVAGGQFEPSGIFHEYAGDPHRKALFADYLRRARDRIVGIQRSGQRQLFGVAERKNYTLDHENPALDEYTPHDVIAPFRRGRLPFAKLRTVGREYSTWLMNPTILLPKLKTDLEADGIPFVERLIASRADLADLRENVVINCTGYGAHQWLGDNQLVPQRGHLVALERTQDRQHYFFSGGCANPSVAYVFCRQNDIVVGGSVQAGNDSATATPEDERVFARILANARRVFGGNPSECLS
jgi:D-amino-acid oxidase